MVRIKKPEIPLLAQAKKMVSYFPDSTYDIREYGTMLVWKGYLQPTALSNSYLIKIVYRKNNHPDVYVIDPKPLQLAKDKEKLEHVYDTKSQHICIYYKRAKEWDKNMWVADTIIPWASEWLLHYEYWVATGSWQGRGIH